MSLKLKALGSGLLMVAVSAFVTMGASATVNGHFTSEATEDHVLVKGASSFGTSHQITFQKEGSEGVVGCTNVKYHGTASGFAATTTQEISVRPTYEGCGTAGGPWGSIIIHIPAECGTNVFKFTSRTAGGHGTAHVECQITITHPNCDITVPKQTPSGGVIYTTTVENNKHAITAGLTFTGVTTHYESGICIFLGTTHAHVMSGSATLWGESKTGARVGITAT